MTTETEKKAKPTVYTDLAELFHSGETPEGKREYRVEITAAFLENIDTYYVIATNPATAKNAVREYLADILMNGATSTLVTRKESIAAFTKKGK